MTWMRRQVLQRLQQRLAGEDVPLRLVLWDGDGVDFGARPTVTITLRSRKLMRPLLTGNVAALGDAYAGGEIDVEGHVEDILLTGIRLSERIGINPIIGGAIRRVGALVPHHRRKDDAAAIRHHYDVSNEFYRLWLDRNMVYSCAYFQTGAEDIDAAQEQKLDHLCRKLRLQPEERLLDIGCGWGGLICWAAKHYGVRATGVTLSEAQLEGARQRVADAGLQDRIELRLQDYRDIPGEGAYDKVVSVGMYEHVGLANLPRYFGILSRLVKPGGAVLNHGIIVTTADGRPQGPPGGEFIDRYVFPGGELPSLSHVLTRMSASGLETADAEDLRPHYARTLQLWVRRLEAHRDEAIRHAGIERYRIWRIFLAGMAIAFDRGWLSIAQVLAYKPLEGRPAPRPWTRRYQYQDRAEPVAVARAIAWDEAAKPAQATEPA